MTIIMINLNQSLRLLVLSLTGLPCLSQAQTLSETIVLAQHYQSEQRLAGLKVEDQLAQLLQIRAKYNPTLSAGASVGQMYLDLGNSKLPIPKSHFTQDVGVQFNYPLYTAGRKQLAIAAAETGVSTAKASQQNIDQQTILAAVSIHAAITRDQALIQLEQDTQHVLDQAQHDAAQRLKAGEVTKTDLAQATARQAQGIANQQRAAANLQIDQARYLQLTGQQPQNIEPIRNIPPVPAELNTAYQLLEQTPQLAEARLQVQAATQQLDLNKRESYPTVELSGRALAMHDQNMSNNIGFYNVGLQANLPILDGGMRHADMLRAQTGVAIAEEKLESLRRQKQKDLAENYATLQADKAQYNALVQARDAAKLALETIQRELQLGTRTTYDLLNAQRDLLDASTQLILNQEEQALNAYQILVDTNQLNAQQY